MNVYGLMTESGGVTALEDFIRMKGAPIGVRRDNSMMQQSEKWHAISRRFVIFDQWTEAYKQQQNPAERAIDVLKWLLDSLLDRTGAPNEAWLE